MGDRSETELGTKIDRCFSDSLLKIAGGLAIGVVSSVAFFKGRTFPVWLGVGIGIGNGWSNCRHDLEAPYVLHGRKVRAGTEISGKPGYQIVVQQPNIK
jgi:inner membrane organizing system protein 1